MKDKTKALIYILISTLSFTFMSATIKYIQDIPVFEKVFFRNLVSLFIAAYLIAKNRPKKITDILGNRQNVPFLLSRSILGFLGVVLNFYAVTNLQLADSQILNRISPIWVAIFALLFLREHLKRSQIISIIIALIGSLLVIKPEFSFEMLPAIAGFISSITAGAAYTIVRYLKDKEEPRVIIFYFSLISLLLSIPLMLNNFIIPSKTQLGLLLLIGLFASVGQFGLTHAYRYAKASRVSIYTYSGIIFASFLGFLIWQEIPDPLSIIGGLLIISSGYIVYRYSRRES
ncbi:MAG: DMT family transporter [Spirochaetaceae bacterium]